MDTQFLLSLVVGVSVGGVGGFLGSLMLGRRMALVAGPLGHLTLPGIALALMYGFDVSLGAFPFVILGIVLIWLFEMRTKLPVEALTAIVFASGVAIAFLLLPIKQAEAALVGDITKVSFAEATVSVILTLLLFCVVKNIYSKIVLIHISEELAKSEKIDIRKYNLVYLGSIAIIVALGVKMVGGLLTAALIAIPASSSRNVSRNLTQYALGAMIIGMISSSMGIWLYKITGFPAGSLIILVNATIFLISLIFKR